MCRCQTLEYRSLLSQSLMKEGRGSQPGRCRNQRSDEELSYSIVSFQDEAGNSGTPPTVSIEYGGSDPSDPIVIDTIAPVITSVSASLSKSDSGMYLNQKRAEPGDTITLTIEANEPLDYLEETDVSMSDTRVSISSVTESDEGRTWVATGTVQEPAIPTRSSHTA